MTSCTNESHSVLKDDPARWTAELDPIGEMDIGGGEVLLFANCRACHSTLVLELPPVAAAQLKRAG